MYLHEQRKQSGLTSLEIRDLTNQAFERHSFTQSQWSMPTKESYEAVQNHLNGKAFNKPYNDLKQEHDDLKQEHDELKQEFYGTRAYFDNSHELMTDIWDYKRVTGSERHTHATPKPVNMMKRVMYSSLKTGAICVEPFGGSGSTLMGAEVTGRHCYTMELQPKYCDVIIKRWQEFTGKQAIHEATGEHYQNIDAINHE